MNVKAPTTGTRGQGKIHTMADDLLTVCRQMPRDTWEETDDPATCKVCLHTAGGWRSIRPRARLSDKK